MRLDEQCSGMRESERGIAAWERECGESITRCDNTSGMCVCACWETERALATEWRDQTEHTSHPTFVQCGQLW